MATPVVNFGLATVSTGYSSSATSIVLQAGDGSRLPSDFPYPLTWWNATDYSHPADDPNREIVSVTARSSDTLTIVRAQEGTSATAKNTSSKTYRMSLGITEAMWESLQTPKNTFQGLQLQTHRDANLAATQVELVSVDSIIMDDGVELRNDNGEWSGKIADSTVSGAGGLDSGTSAVSTWYEIYAIAKEDGTRNLLLHQSKLWSISTNYPTGDDTSQPIRGATSTAKVAQGFKASSGLCPYIEALLLKVGAPTGTIWFTIESDNAGKPSGTVLATSHAYDVSRLPTSKIWVRFPMKSSSALSASTQYHLVAQGTWATSASNYVAWRIQGTGNSYANGTLNLYDSGTTTWTDSGDDALFAVSIQSNVSLVTLPSGYTKQCFLGWVRTDGSGNFIPFIQVNRSRRVQTLTSANCVVWSMSGAAERIDILSFLPPRDIISVLMGFAGNGTSAGLIAIGDLRATDISSAGDTTGAQAVIYCPTTTTRPGAFAEVIVQSLGIMAMGTASSKLWIVGFEW